MKKSKINTILVIEGILIIIVVFAIVGVIIVKHNSNDEESEPVAVPYEVDFSTESYVPNVPESAPEPVIEEIDDAQEESAENEVGEEVPDLFKAQLISAVDSPELWSEVNNATAGFVNKLEVKNVQASMDDGFMYGVYFFKNSSATCEVVAKSSNLDDGILVSEPYGKYGQNYDALIIWDCETPWFDEALQDALYEAGYYGVRYDGHYVADTGDIFLDNINPDEKSIQFNEEDFR